MEHSRLEYEKFRQQQYELVELYVGSNYGATAKPEKPTYVNLIEFFVNTFTRFLIPKAPRMLVTTKFRQLRPLAADLSASLDVLAERIELAETLRMAVYDSLFFQSVVKTGAQADIEFEIDGQTHVAGQPFVDVVQPEDFVADMAATRWSHCAFYGNRFRLPLEVVMESPLYKGRARDRLRPTPRQQYHEQGDPRLRMLSSTYGEADEIEDYVELWDVYLPRGDGRRGLMVTMSEELGSDEPFLRVEEWRGPEKGPYRRLAFNLVSGNLMPLSPLSVLKDLHVFANKMADKVYTQAERQKSLLGYAGVSTDEAQAVLQSPDGGSFRCEDPNRLKQMEFGGPNQLVMLAYEQSMNLFKQMGGSLDVLAGIGPQAETAAQDQLLSAASSRRVQDMAEHVIGFVRGIAKDLAWYTWNAGETLSIPFSKDLGPFQLVNDLSSVRREGQFLDYNFGIEPYSMQAITPQQRAGLLVQLFTQVVMPAAPMLMQRGEAPNVRFLLEKYGEYMDLPEAEELLVAAAMPQMEEPPMGESAKMAPQTKREYIRRSVSQSTPGGKSDIMSRLMAGGGVTGSQRAALSR